jgi:hypothetical protein
MEMCRVAQLVEFLPDPECPIAIALSVTDENICHLSRPGVGTPFVASHRRSVLKSTQSASDRSRRPSYVERSVIKMIERIRSRAAKLKRCGCDANPSVYRVLRENLRHVWRPAANAAC